MKDNDPKYLRTQKHIGCFFLSNEKK